MDIFRLALTKKIIKDDSGVVSKLQTKTINTNGVFTPDSGYNGFSKVIVNVTAEEYDGTVEVIDNGN